MLNISTCKSVIAPDHRPKFVAVVSAVIPNTFPSNECSTRVMKTASAIASPIQKHDKPKYSS